MTSIRDVRARYARAKARALDDVAFEVVSEAKSIISQDAIDTGTLNRSDEVRTPNESTRVVAFTAEHSVYVHFGSRPHFPPLAPILAWVRRNLSRITVSGQTQDVLKAGLGSAGRTTKPPEKVIEDVARAIQAKIGREGTEAVPFLTMAVGRVRPRVASIVQESYQREGLS